MVAKELEKIVEALRPYRPKKRCFLFDEDFLEDPDSCYELLVPVFWSGSCRPSASRGVIDCLNKFECQNLIVLKTTADRDQQSVMAR